MQEEVENRAVTLVISATKLTGRLLKAAILKYLASRKEKRLQKARAAPEKPTLPQMHSTLPKVPLWPMGSRRGRRPRTHEAVISSMPSPPGFSLSIARFCGDGEVFFPVRPEYLVPPSLTASR